MQKYIVICIGDGAKIILSKQFYNDQFDGTTLKVIEKSSGQEKFKYRIKCYGWNMEEVIYVVEEKEEVPQTRTLPKQQKAPLPETIS